MSIVPIIAVMLQLTTGPNVVPETPLTAQQIASVRAQIETINAAHAPPAETALANALVLSEMTHFEPRGQCVPTGATNIRTSPATAVPLIREHILNGRAVNGWVVKFTPEGCGDREDVIYTVANSADDNMRLVRMGTGETLATATITNDLGTLTHSRLPQLFSLNGVQCEIGEISQPSMRIVQQGDGMGDDFFGTRLSGSWVEEWSYEGCGHRATVPVELQWNGRTGALFQMRFDTPRFAPLSDS